ncbi:uncharacterized protein LOC120350888 [Nilaparvata lugens]|uniref:uncharacterized protein LOC120350888 n=1 Tax=Nilaparvata lugens TaxID=108931 RepID=UPI00193E5583|nr:uncharacterized protein LOC120350888 [Nilaparvata lugens]
MNVNNYSCISSRVKLMMDLVKEDNSENEVELQPTLEADANNSSDSNFIEQFGIASGSGNDMVEVEVISIDDCSGLREMVNTEELCNGTEISVDVPILNTTNVTDDLSSEGVLISELDASQEATSSSTSASNFTKQGIPRKRRKFEKSVLQRKVEKNNELKNKHKVREGCLESCRLQCRKNISEEDRVNINSQFWDLAYAERKSFVLNMCERLSVKRRTSGCDIEERESRKNTYKYFLKNSEGQTKQVCKSFFLTTLGYEKKNDRFVFDVLNMTPASSLQPKPDMRGRATPANNCISKQEVCEHIESFNPVISHYRREHAPLRRYLPSDVNIKLMHKDFLMKFPNIQVSYDFYRKEVGKNNISFAVLGNEECETCESFEIEHLHKKYNLQSECTKCSEWKIHLDLAKTARELYKEHLRLYKNHDNTVCYTADLQKVIMLPRMESFKAVLFAKRLVAYNESFVPVGEKSKHKTFATVWHEGISGRKKEDIVSTFYAFFLWLDICAGQNKSWCFLSFLVFLVNSDRINAKEITLCYFIPGHTFMAADSFHHCVESALKKQIRTYDFDDFKEAVATCKAHVEVKNMQAADFFSWQDHSSQLKLKQETRHYLRDMACIKVVRDSYTLKYKTSHDQEDFHELDFLKKSACKPGGMKMPNHLERPCGFPKEKRDDI